MKLGQNEKRLWQPREMRLVAEYLINRYPNDRTQTRVRLGPIVPRNNNGTFANDAELKMAGIWRRWADAVIFKPDQVIILEAAIRPEPGDIMKLELYANLFRETPEFKVYSKLPIKKLLLFAIEDKAIRMLAYKYNVAVDFFLPQWCIDYLNNCEPRERRMPDLPLFD